MIGILVQLRYLLLLEENAREFALAWMAKYGGTYHNALGIWPVIYHEVHSRDLSKPYVPLRLIGQHVLFISKSGKEWSAIITGIPENPWHGYTDLPTVSLEFRNERNKLVRKTRVTPFERGRFDTQVWKWIN